MRFESTLQFDLLKDDLSSPFVEDRIIPHLFFNSSTCFKIRPEVYAECENVLVPYYEADMKEAQERALEVHNKFHSWHGVPPLKLSNKVSLHFS